MAKRRKRFYVNSADHGYPEFYDERSAIRWAEAHGMSETHVWRLPSE